MSKRRPVLVVDSSVAVKWFEPDELGVKAALTVLDGHQDERYLLAAPTLLRLEVLSALARMGLDETELVQAAGTLEGFRLHFEAVDGELVAHAVKLATRHGLTIYDAVFAALAKRHDAELITADRRLARSDACSARLLG